MMDNTNLFRTAAKSIAFAWRTNRSYFLAIIFLNLFLGAVVYLQFTSFSLIVDEIVRIKDGTGERSKIVQASVILGLSFLVPTILTNILSYIRSQFRMQQALELEMFKIEKQSGLDIGTIESNDYQTLLRSAKEWGSGSVLSLQDFIFTSASSIGGIVTSMFILWSLHPVLVIFALAAALPVYFFYKKYSLEVFRVRHLSIDDHRIINNRISHFEELHKAVDVILLKLKEWLKHDIFNRKRIYNSKISKAERKKATSYALLSIWYLLFLFSAIALMTTEALSGTIAVGGLLLAFNTYTRFYQTINGYVENISYTEEAARYAAKWFELFDLKPGILSKHNAIRMNRDIVPLIEFQNVSFRYPNNPTNKQDILSNVSFQIKPGEKVAIVGLNGAGKTTLIKLLCRVYDPTEGRILVDGRDLRDIDLSDWQSLLGILFQDFPVYNVTFRESIGIGNIDEALHSKPERLLDAARYSGADEFITDYDQLIWRDFRNGVDLSKGQHQRLAVARMFYRSAAITILDEPTASIDAVTEEKIFQSLEGNTEGRTVILITHRFSTVKNADTILLLEQGKIIEQGTHLQLMRNDGKYAALYNVQARRYLERSVASMSSLEQS